MKYSLLVFVLFAVLVGNASPDSIRMEKRGDAYFIIHQVDPQETVFSLARRYNVDSKNITRVNRIQNNEIKIGQFLEIPYGEFEIAGLAHEVGAGESLYSIAKKYGVSISDLRRWNRLKSNDLSIGQELIIEEQESDEEPLVADATKVIKEDSALAIYEHFVQSGESLQMIADRFERKIDSLVILNELSSHDLKIGQRLLLPFAPTEEVTARASKVNDYVSSPYGSKIRSKSEGGVTEIFEEGIIKRIETTAETNKYLALHRSKRIGSIIEVKNLMNNLTIYVRVVGKLPDTGINKNVMIRVTEIAYNQLRIVDNQGLVEINYFKD